MRLGDKIKIIFLDIDGILNYTGCKYKLGSIYFVDPAKLELLKQLIDRTDAKIVLSSTWRYGWEDIDNGKSNTQNAKDFIALRNKCSQYGIEFMDYTPNFSFYRGDEIKKWLEMNNVESFVILDDDNDMKPYMGKLVQTSFTKGLLQKHVDKAVKILNGEE